MVNDFDPGLSPHHYASFERRYAAGRLTKQDQRILLTGLRSTDSGAEDFKIKKLESELSGESLFGKDSQLDKMCRAAFKAHSTGEFYAISMGADAAEVTKTIEAIPERQFTQIATSVEDPASLKLFDAYLEKMWGYAKQLDGHLFAASKKSLSEIIKTYSIDSEAENPQTIMNHKHVTLMHAEGSESEHYEWAAVLAATVARYAWPPYKPFQTLPLLGLKPQDRGPSLDDKNELLKHGLSTFYVDAGEVKIDRLVSTHNLKNGVKDDSYRDLSKKMILSYLRYDILAYLKKAFPRHGLAKAGLYEGDVVSPDSLRPQIIAHYKSWVRENLVQFSKDFERNLKIQVRPNGETVDMMLPVLLMGQLRSTVTTISFNT